MDMPDFHFERARNSDQPMACRVYAGERCIGFMWRSWPSGDTRPVWVTRLTPAGPDLSTEPTKRCAALVLLRIAGVMDEQRQAVAV